MEADIAPRTIEERSALILKALQYSIDTHGWTLAWDERGIRLSHDGNSVVLGISDSLRAYVDGATV